MPLITAHELGKTFTSTAGTATQALKNASLSIEEGEYIAIMGQSGSGKSTLLHILGLLIEPTTGTYQLNGQNVAHLSDTARAHMRNTNFGFIFQAFHLLARTSVLDNVMLPLIYSHEAVSSSKGEHQKRALNVLEQVELSHRLEHTPAQLSGGEKQRVAIGRALVNQPKVIFADEPTGNLDSKTGEKIMKIFENLHKSGHTIIVITHESITADYAQRVITLRDGEIASDAPHNREHTHYAK